MRKNIIKTSGLAHLKLIQNIHEVVIEVFAGEGWKSGFCQFLLCRIDGSSEPLELGSIAEQVFKVGKSEGAVEAVPIGSGPANMTKLGSQGLDFLKVDGVTGKFL